MFLRISTVKRNGKTYTYGQLVESVRRPSDGRPTHNVIASLGRMSVQEADNLRAALSASRQGKRVVVAPATKKTTKAAPKPLANLKYLDVAVLLEIWRQWGLDELLESLLAAGGHEVSPAAVVAALAIHRCVDAGSKLCATRWFPRTALPELLNISTATFNNSRLHRVLELLEENASRLMSMLPRRYAEREGTFASLFMDVTDAWFVGHGPELAERGKTKEGLIQRKIGIVLLCNEHGYPVRWEVVSGRSADNVVMGEMLGSIAGLSWVGETPLVCDRAMGTSKQLAQMLATKLHFLTALNKTEFSSYCPDIPYKPLVELDINGLSAEKAAEHVAEHVRQLAVLSETESGVFFLDCGIVERSADERKSTNESSSSDDVNEERTVRAMRLCREIEGTVADGRHSSYAAAGRSLGLTRGQSQKYRILGRLPDALQRDILDGKAAGRSLADLVRVARLEARDEQFAQFQALLQSPDINSKHFQNTPAATATSESAPAVRVRAVVVFNPELFVQKRSNAAKRLEQVQAFTRELNSKLAASPARWTRDKATAAVDRYLRKHSLLELYRVQVTETEVLERIQLQVALELDETDWLRRRRYDGFSVLVAHPDVALKAPELHKLYRAKDSIEKDFQIIKSVVKLRPVRHRSDAKVRAHVALCMLALLLERTLKRRLASTSYTAEAALELLAPCHLNQYQTGAQPSVYTITQLDREQHAILRKLRLQHLGDDNDVAERIAPR